MTFAAVGSAIQIQASTFNLTPVGVGNIILFEVTQAATGVTATSMSSTNVTWATFGTSATATTGGSSVLNSTAQVFIGTVTSTSTATVTITFTGGTPATIDAAGREFSTTAGASNVKLDVQAKLDSTGTNTWASLTPGHGAGELYFGMALDNGAASAGTTSGYTYFVTTANNGMAFNASAPNTSTAPVWNDSGQAFGIMVLAYEAGAVTLAPFFPKPAIRARSPLPARGRVYANPGGPVTTPSTSGPPVNSAGQPAGILPVLVRTGTSLQTATSPPAVVPPVIVPAPLYPWRGPVRAPVPQTWSKGRTAANPGASVRNITSGPVFKQATAPIQVRIPQTWSKGRAYGISSGAPVQNATHGPAFKQAVTPVKAFPKTWSKGRVYPGAGAPARNSTQGPSFVQADQPVQARRPLPARGRTWANPGVPAAVVPVPTVGPVFQQATQSRPRIPQNAPRGRTASNAGAPVQNAAQGPSVGGIRPMRGVAVVPFRAGR